VNAGPGVIPGFPDGYLGEAAIFQVMGSGFDLFGGIGNSFSPTAAGNMCSSQPALVSPSNNINYTINQAVSSEVRMEFTPQVGQAFDGAVSAMNSLGLVPTINSAYRTAADQALMVAGGSGSNPAAAVGRSPHQAGQAVDINGGAGFSTMRTIMEIFGFGRVANDPPHFQMTSGNRSAQINLAATYRAVCSVGRSQ
jgi:hypothetical protein